MLLTEYDEKKHMRDTYREGYNDGERAGYDKGYELTKKVYQAHMRGDSIETIAKECNIPVSQVEDILK